MPKRSCDVMKHEVARCLKLTRNGVESMRFRIPRKSRDFQEDLFPDAPFPLNPMSADDYFSGKNKDQELSSLDPKQRTDASGGSVFVAAKTSTELSVELAAANAKIVKLEKMKLELLAKLKAKGITPLKITPPPAPVIKKTVVVPPAPVFKKTVVEKVVAPVVVKTAAATSPPVVKKISPAKEVKPVKKMQVVKKAASPKKEVKQEKKIKKKTVMKKADYMKEISNMCKDLDRSDVKKIHVLVKEIWEADGN